MSLWCVVLLCLVSSSIPTSGSHSGFRSNVLPIYRRISPSKLNSLLPSYLKTMVNRKPISRPRPPFLFSSSNRIPMVIKGGSKSPVISKTFLNRGCPVLRCPDLRIRSGCKVPVLFRYNGRLCRGCYRNICSNFTWRNQQ